MSGTFSGAKGEYRAVGDSVGDGDKILSIFDRVAWGDPAGVLPDLVLLV